MSHSWQLKFKPLVAVSFISLLTACGGGGGSGSDPDVVDKFMSFIDKVEGSYLTSGIIDKNGSISYSTGDSSYSATSESFLRGVLDTVTSTEACGTNEYDERECLFLNDSNAVNAQIENPSNGAVSDKITILADQSGNHISFEQIVYGSNYEYDLEAANVLNSPTLQTSEGSALDGTWSYKVYEVVGDVPKSIGTGTMLCTSNDCTSPELTITNSSEDFSSGVYSGTASYESYAYELKSVLSPDNRVLAAKLCPSGISPYSQFSECKFMAAKRN